MLGLAHAAINQIPAELINGVPLFLAGPEPLPEMPLPMRSNFIQLLQLQAEIDINFEASKVYPMGRAAGFYALESAFQYLEVSAEEFVLVGGVDSYKDFVQLDSLAQVNRIQTESGQSDAFIPGEGAAFILLSSNERFRNNGQVFRPGIAEEIGHRYSDEPYLGNGLSSAFSQAIEHAKSENIGAIYSSLNGESFGVKEFGVACTRNRCNIADSFNHVHPADCFGDLGGATSIVLIALASMNENTETLCFGASDHEFRGVAVVS